MTATKKPPTAALTTLASRRRCEELLDEIARKKTFISEAFVDIGVALVEIEKKELFKTLGYTTFGELLTERGVIDALELPDPDRTLEPHEPSPARNGIIIGGVAVVLLLLVGGVYLVTRNKGAGPTLSSENTLPGMIKTLCSMALCTKSVPVMRSPPVTSRAPSVRPTSM